MKIRWWIIIGITIILASIFILIGFKLDNEIETNHEFQSDAHQSSYMEKSFYEGIEQDSYQDLIPEKIYGGVVSHHLLAKENIAQFFAELRSQPVETVVLIGPNHFSVGKDKMTISLQDFETPYGRIEVNKKVAEDLLKSDIVKVNEEPFVAEHSIAALTPYIAYNFPDAQIVPIILRHDVSRPQLDDLVKNLEKVLPENSVVIASVDFSHHLNRIATEFHDVASVSAIKDFDFERIFNLEIDSPASIYTLLKYLEKKDAKNITYKNLNSTDFTGSLDTTDATSYVFAHFTQGSLLSSKTNATSLHFGDMMFDKKVKDQIQNSVDPFEYIKGTEANFLKGVDVMLGNLEGVISTSSDCKNDKEVTFKFDVSIVTLLKKYNFSGVNLANNHTNDCYEHGVLSTEQEFKKSGMITFGNELKSGYFIKNVGTEKIAIIGVNEINTSSKNIPETLVLIEKLAKENDSVVAHVHWGYEYQSLASEEQRAVAHQLIDAGVQVIIGHHPHVVQEMELYNGGIIFYSVGNFIFDQVGVGVNVGFGVGLIHQNGVQEVIVFPYNIKNSQPELMPYHEMESFCDKLLLFEVGRKNECGFVLDKY